jgi:voltage-gated potassium channel
MREKGLSNAMVGAENSPAEKPAAAGIHRLFARSGAMATGERLLVLVGIGAVLIGTLPGLTGFQDTLLTILCVVIALAFAGIYALLLWSAENRRRHARSLYAIIDLLAALPVPLALLLGMSAPNARLFGMLWALKLIHLNPAFAMLWRVLRNERQPLLSVTTAFVVVTLFASTIAFVVERNAQPDAFGSVPAALWWAVTTITTTGYGDKIPVTFVGRILGGAVMVAGIGLFALWAGILASGFAAELRRREFLESWDLVVRLPLFRNLGAGALAEIARLLKVQNHSAKSVIVRTGQPGDSMYFIAEGEVEVHAGPVRVRLKPGQFFGEAALITGEPRNATVVAAGPARLLRLDVIEFRELASRQPELLTIIQAEAAHRAAKPT